MSYREEELEKAIINCVDRMDSESLMQYVIDDMWAYYRKADQESVDQLIEDYGDGCL